MRSPTSGQHANSRIPAKARERLSGRKRGDKTRGHPAREVTSQNVPGRASGSEANANTSTERMGEGKDVVPECPPVKIQFGRELESNHRCSVSDQLITFQIKLIMYPHRASLCCRARGTLGAEWAVQSTRTPPPTQDPAISTCQRSRLPAQRRRVEVDIRPSALRRAHLRFSDRRPLYGREKRNTFLGTYFPPTCCRHSPAAQEFFRCTPCRASASP